MCVCCFFEAHQLLKGVQVIKKECREHSVWGFLVAKNAKTLTFMLSVRGGTPL